MICPSMNYWKKMDHLLYISTIVRLIEMFKVYNNLPETFLSDIRQENTYNFRTNRDFQIPRLNTVWNGSNSIRYFGPIIWDLIPSELEYTSLLENFKRKFLNGNLRNVPVKFAKCLSRTYAFEVYLNNLQRKVPRNITVA